MRGILSVDGVVAGLGDYSTGTGKSSFRGLGVLRPLGDTAVGLTAEFDTQLGDAAMFRRNHYYAFATNRGLSP